MKHMGEPATKTILVPSSIAGLLEHPPINNWERAAYAYAFTAKRQGRYNHDVNAPMSYTEFAALNFYRMGSIPSVRDWRQRWEQVVEEGIAPPAVRGTTIVLDNYDAIAAFYDHSKQTKFRLTNAERARQREEHRRNNPLPSFLQKPL